MKVKFNNAEQVCGWVSKCIRAECEAWRELTGFRIGVAAELCIVASVSSLQFGFNNIVA